MTQSPMYSQNDDIAAPAGRRPRQATTAAVLLIVIGALGVVLSLLLVSVLGDATANGAQVSGVAEFLVFAQLAVSGAQIVSGAFVLPGRHWARTLGITMTSLNLVGGILSLFSAGAFALVGVVLNVVLISLLTGRDVRYWCGG